MGAREAGRRCFAYRQGIRTLLLAAAFDHSRVTALRHEVASCAAAAGLTGERLDDFVVAVDELVTNAVRHGGGVGRLSLWRRSDDVLCEVSDDGRGLPGPGAVPHRPAPDQPGGRGLWLAEVLTDRLEIQSDADGTTVRILTRIRSGS